MKSHFGGSDPVGNHSWRNVGLEGDDSQDMRLKGRTSESSFSLEPSRCMELLWKSPGLCLLPSWITCIHFCRDLTPDRREPTCEEVSLHWYIFAHSQYINPFQTFQILCFLLRFIKSRVWSYHVDDF